MKEHLFIALVGLVMCQFATAQIIGTCYDVQTIDGMSFFAMYRVSNNGQWAVASEGLIDNDGTYNSTYAGILWSRETGEYTIVNPDYDGTVEHGLLLCDVSDDGRIVGAYPRYVTDEDTGETYQRWWPGYKDLDGDWVPLSIPDSAALSATGGPLDLKYNTLPKRVSADGKIIVGECWMYKGNGKCTYEPVQWFLDEEDNLIETRLFDYLEYGSSYGFTVQDMSNDGHIIAGSMTSVRNDSYPAMIIDGELEAVAQPNLIKQEGYEDYYLESEIGYDEEPYEWWAGEIYSLDSYGNAYYYYSDGVGKLHSGVLNLETGEVTEYSRLVTCGIPGFVCGQSSVFVGKDINLDGMNVIGNMSDDGTVVAGCGYGYATLYDYNYPLLYVYPESPSIYAPDPEPEPEGIETIAAENNNGDIYTITGQKVATPVKGVNIVGGKKVVVK